jgi:hypothetical protein
MKLRRDFDGETIAAASAALLLVIMSLTNWFGADLGRDSLPFGRDLGSADAWTALPWIRWVLLFTIVVAFGAAVMKAADKRADTPVELPVIVTWCGGISTLLILVRIAFPPEWADAPEGLEVSITREFGVFLGLLAAAGIAYGGWRAMTSERRPRKQAGRDRPRRAVKRPRSV